MLPLMKISLFWIANYILVAVLVVLFVRYLWIIFILHDDEPRQWRQAMKEGRVPDKVKRMKRRYIDKVRFFTWWFQVERLRTQNVPGAFAELGVYRGDSARILHHMDPARPFHLFDTFEGFSPRDLAGETGEAATYTTHHFADTSRQAVIDRIGGNENIHLHPGHFPGSAAGFREPLALVNLDADLYKPTRAGLEYFYPLLSPGGVMLVHDYNDNWPGVMKAVDEFVATIPEGMCLIPDIEGTAVIVRNV